MKKSEKKPTFLNQTVEFFDPSRGFWRLGFCYKEEKKWVSVRRSGRKRGHKVPNSPEFIRLPMENKQPQKA